MTTTETTRYCGSAEYHMVETDTCNFLVGCAGKHVVCTIHGWACTHGADAQAWIDSQPRDRFGLLVPDEDREE